jgi:hypothetical protein
MLIIAMLSVVMHSVAVRPIVLNVIMTSVLVPPPLFRVIRNPEKSKITSHSGSLVKMREGWVDLKSALLAGCRIVK